MAIRSQPEGPLTVLVRALAGTAVYGLLLFVPAGTVAWQRAWLLLAAIATARALTPLTLKAGGGDLFEQRRRSPFAAGQPSADRGLVAAFAFAGPACFVFVSLDVFRLHLMPPPNALLSDAGLAAFGTGLVTIAAAVRANRFAIGMVRHQSERGHVLVDRGVYAVVRHPLYSGVLLAACGGALWLESSAGALAIVIPALLVIIRIGVEEKLLVQQLAGYAGYVRRVRARLIPFVW